MFTWWTRYQSVWARSILSILNLAFWMAMFLFVLHLADTCFLGFGNPPRHIMEGLLVWSTVIFMWGALFISGFGVPILVGYLLYLLIKIMRKAAKN